ncbi:hypothetical protein BCR42DRAFT_406514 [Absidia repens]|uniref:Ornithine decarboxylase antizyme n=1 Tax=Absidia repens TaxID=90262 RepID=A0A1X2IUX8_9FUNG|nr:hypothetical protein BCR42DRAFT_406514 [Absidia repens]
MIIAKPAKKSVSIPLQTFLVPISSAPFVEQNLPTDAITFINRCEGDFVDKVFGKSNIINKVEQVLSITTTATGPYHQNQHTFQSQACIHNQTVFLCSPFVGTNTGKVKWAPGGFQSCITHLIDLAEETTGCSEMVVVIDQHDKTDSNTLLRAFMYLGFELLNPSLYNQNSGFTLVGYEF